ncbi:hypothetical protein KAI87_09655, partial [Myxococcota bacterium]|nr:hypothetical protein [Myxococcota bacterium]
SEKSSGPSALRAAFEKISPSLGLAMASTVFALLILATAQVPALRQMALIGSSAIVGSFLGNLLWLPVLIPSLAKSIRPPSPDGPWSWGLRLARYSPRAVSFAAILLVIGALVGMQNLRVDGDVRNLDTRSPEAALDLKEFAAAFGDPESSALALVHAKTLDQALLKAEATTQLLTEHGANRILSPTLLAPSHTRFSQRFESICSTQEELMERFGKAALQAGFSPKFSEGFAHKIQTLCANDVSKLWQPRKKLDAFSRFLGKKFFRESDAEVEVAIAFEAPEAALVPIKEAFEKSENIFMVHRASLNQRLIKIIVADLPRLAFGSVALVFILLLFFYRNISSALRALFPSFLALLSMLALFSLFDIPINLMNLAVFPLLAGLGIDYGVLMENDGGPELLAERSFSVFVASATTLAGFGTLAIARYYAIATIGQSVLVAVGLSALFALLFPPAFRQLSSDHVKSKK